MPLNHGLIDSIDISLAGLPAALEGFRIAHLSDLHLRRVRPHHRRMLRQLARLRIDLVVMTGDYQADPGFEAAAVELCEELCAQVRPSHGIFAVNGNHDTSALCHQTAHLPIRWLNNTGVTLERVPIDILGFEHTYTAEPDSVATLLNIAGQRSDAPKGRATAVLDAPMGAKTLGVISSSASEYASGEIAAKRAKPQALVGRPRAQRTMRFLLSHAPNMLPTASELGVDLMFAGHSHGGQVRLGPGRPLYNSSDLPLRLTSGVLRHRDTICLVSRGLGHAGLPLRFFCPAHIPIYTLHEGPSPGQYTEGMENVRPW